MKTSALAASVGVSLYLLHLSDTTNPDWLAPVSLALLFFTVCMLGMSLADETSIKNEPVRPEFDEHRDNSI